MTRMPLISLLLLLVLPAGTALAQAPRVTGWQLAAGVGPYRIDDLAGTPVIPSLSLMRSGRLIGGATLSGIRGAGRYTLDAVALDLDLGVPFGTARTEGSVTIGPSVLLGGDSDGTPYIGGGGHVTVAGTWWVSTRIGLTAAGSARGMVRSGGILFTPGVWAGVRLRL